MGRASEGFDLYTYLLDPPGCALAHTQRTAAPAPRNTGQSTHPMCSQVFSQLVVGVGGILTEGGAVDARVLGRARHLPRSPQPVRGAPALAVRLHRLEEEVRCSRDDHGRRRRTLAAMRDAAAAHFRATRHACPSRTTA